jgi:sortase A
MLGYAALSLLGASLYQRAAARTLDGRIHAEVQNKNRDFRTAIREGDVLGRLAIPRIGLSVMILQGTSSQTLHLGVGHIDGTALPGESGHIGIAGHRDTYFRSLKGIQRNDEIQIQTESGTAKYVVDWLQITAPGDVDILSPPEESAVTLVTCYPFRYVGSAPERFVVHAHKL